MRSEWKRTEGGYLRRDGEWFLQRGARMSDGGTAWLIFRRVDEARKGRDTGTIHDTSNGLPLWSVDDTGYTSTEAPDFTGDLYAHEYDAGALAEAKATVAHVETRHAVSVPASGPRTHQTETDDRSAPWPSA